MVDFLFIFLNFVCPLDGLVDDWGTKTGHATLQHLVDANSGIPLKILIVLVRRGRSSR